MQNTATTPVRSIEVFGPGCKKCTTLFSMVKSLVKADEHIKISKISDPMLFAVRGVITTPALAIDGNIVLCGSVPSQAELQKLLQEHGFSARQPDSQDSDCCSSSSESSSSCCNSSAEPKQACCSEAAAKPASIKRIVITVVLILLLLVGVRLYNQQQRSQTDGNLPPAATKAGGIDERLD